MQRQRRTFQIAFFALFLLAPALNLLRFDVTEVQLWVLGQRWSLGIDDFRQGLIGPGDMALRLFLRALLPAVLLVGGFLAVAGLGLADAVRAAVIAALTDDAETVAALSEVAGAVLGPLDGHA